MDRACRPHWPWPFWVIAQAAVVAAFAAGVRPSGGYPLPVAATADVGLAAVQLMLAALIGPDLFGGPARAVRVTAAALPFVALAAALAGRSAADTVRLAGLTACWAVALAGPTGPTIRQILILLTVAGPVLWYVALEYGGRDVPLGSWPTLATPVLGVCSTTLHASRFWAAIAPPTLVLCVTSGAAHRSRKASRDESP